jgi:energy-converting hydrogenase B subunit D
MTIDTSFLHPIILVIMLACAIFAAASKDLLYSAIALALLSVLLALEFFLLRAPDVAIAEAAIGAAVTTALFIIAIRATKRSEKP